MCSNLGSVWKILFLTITLFECQNRTDRFRNMYGMLLQVTFYLRKLTNKLVSARRKTASWSKFQDLLIIWDTSFPENVFLWLWWNILRKNPLPAVLSEFDTCKWRYITDSNFLWNHPKHFTLKYCFTLTHSCTSCKSDAKPTNDSFKCFIASNKSIKWIDLMLVKTNDTFHYIAGLKFS